MIFPALRAALLLPTLGAALLATGCGGAGSYELSWTIGCETPGDPSCEPQSVQGCSRVGLDSVEVEAFQGTSRRRSVFSCFSADDGPMGRGPDLEAGATDLRVYGLSPAGVRITGEAVVVTVDVPETGVVQASVDLPVPAQCLDGVDNDGDGLVDLLDPGCTEPTDTDEAD